MVVGPIGAGSNNTGLQWAAGWTVFLDAGTPPEGAPTDPGTVIRQLPAPVSVAGVSSSVVSPDGRTLASIDTPALQISFMNFIAVGQGTNQVTKAHGIVVNQTVVYDIPAPSSTSQAMIRVQLIDGKGESRTVLLTSAIRQERTVSGPCTTRDQPSGSVRIGPSGPSPKELHPTLGICVAFANQDTVPHAIRSDPHPAHSDCPELNLGILEPGATRVTPSINTWGTCGYHDELRPGDEQFRGRFTIDGPPRP